MPTEAPAYPVDAVNRVKRLHERAAYDHATVHAILDASALAHVAYVIDGQPYCTPTLFWREGHRLYWHGSSASRMLRHQATGVPVCVTVSHLDSLVLARCGFNHSVDYRSVMAFGHAVLVFTVLGAPQPCPDLTPDIARPAGLGPYQEGRRLDEALTEAHKIAYDEPH